METPEWVLGFKRPGCEIKRIRGRYYLYERKSEWDPERKKPKKKSGKYLGALTEAGLVPPKAQRPAGPAPVLAKEYGATALLASLSGDILAALAEHLGARRGKAAYVAALLRLVSHCPMRRLGARYESSWASEALPGVALSPASVSGLLDDIGNDRLSCAAFMRASIPPSPYLAVDGTQTRSWSVGVSRARAGNPRKNGFDPQVSQVYIVSLSGGSAAPAFYRNVAGNVPDVSAFQLTIMDAGVSGATVVADSGFASAENFALMEGLGLDYVVPLRRNTSEVRLAGLALPGAFAYNKRAIRHATEQREGYAVHVFRDEKARAQELSDLAGRIERHNAAAADRARRAGAEPEGLRDASAELAAAEPSAGAIILRTSLGKPAREIYEIYKLRWSIEEMFDTMRNTLDMDASGMHDDAGLDAWAFVNHVELMVACRAMALLRERGVLREHSLQDVLASLAGVQAIRVGGEWTLSETTKSTKKLLSNLGVSLDIHSLLIPNL